MLKPFNKFIPNFIREKRLKERKKKKRTRIEQILMFIFIFSNIHYHRGQRLHFDSFFASLHLLGGI